MSEAKTISEVYAAAVFRKGRDVAPPRVPPGKSTLSHAQPLRPIDTLSFLEMLTGPPQPLPPDFCLSLVDARFCKRSTLESLLIDLEAAARRWRGRAPHANLAPSIEAIRRHLEQRREMAWTF